MSVSASELVVMKGINNIESGSITDTFWPDPVTGKM